MISIRTNTKYRSMFQWIIGCSLMLLPFYSIAADITVSRGCSLANAIRSANTDTAIRSCTAGSGADNVILNADVTLTTAEVPAETTGLPIITSDITILGNNKTIARDSGAASTFRIFKVNTGAVLTLNRVTIKDGGGFGYSESGGGVENEGTLLVIDSTFTGNEASEGAGVDNLSGALGISGSTFISNKAKERGGAVLNLGGFIGIINSTFSENEAEGNFSQSGSAIHNQSGTANILNATFSGNKSSEASSGAIHNQGTLNLDNSILGSNSPRDCSGAPVVNLGENLSEDDSGGCVFDTITGLSPIAQNNGGPTLTHALFADSNAINKAGACGLPTDQRGMPRSDGSCDSGAYEFEGSVCQLLEIMNVDYTSVVTLQDCEIHVGPNVIVRSTGNLTLTAGERVVLKPGFSVEKAGQLAINFDPALSPSLSLLEEQQGLMLDQQLQLLLQLQNFLD
jgi:hypothetical protein